MNIMSFGAPCPTDSPEMHITFEDEYVLVTGTVYMTDFDKIIATVTAQRPDFTMLTPAFRYIWPDAKLVITSRANEARMRQRIDQELPRTADGWLQSTQQGISSRYLMSCAGIRKVDAQPGYPVDAASFGLCAGMFNWCGLHTREDILAALQAATEADPKWGPYAAVWFTLSAFPEPLLDYTLAQMAQKDHRYISVGEGLGVAMDPLVEHYRAQLPGIPGKEIAQKIWDAATSYSATLFLTKPGDR